MNNKNDIETLKKYEERKNVLKNSCLTAKSKNIFLHKKKEEVNEKHSKVLEGKKLEQKFFASVPRPNDEHLR